MAKAARTRRKDPEPEEIPEWDFRTFPVFFGFACGAFVATLLLGFFSFLDSVVFILAVFGVSFGMAHITTNWWRRRQVAKLKQRREEDERERSALVAREAARTGEAPPTAPRRRRRRRGTRNE